MANAGCAHACKDCALCRAVTCRRHLEGLGRRPGTGAAGRSRRLAGTGGFASSSAEPPENTFSKSRMKSATIGAFEATARCSPLSALALELVDQFKLPTIRSAVVSLTTSRAFEWCPLPLLRRGRPPRRSARPPRQPPGRARQTAVPQPPESRRRLRPSLSGLRGARAQPEPPPLRPRH